MFRRSLLSSRVGIPQNHTRVILGGEGGASLHPMPGTGSVPRGRPRGLFSGEGGFPPGGQGDCSDSPVRIECLNYALRRDERYGVWGGMSERERRRLKRMAS